MKGLQRLYTGDFNSMQIECLPDGSRIITLAKDGDPKVYRFRVKDLYGPNEEVLEHEEIDVKTPDYILERVKKAQEEQPKGG